MLITTTVGGILSSRMEISAGLRRGIVEGMICDSSQLLLKKGAFCTVTLMFSSMFSNSYILPHSGLLTYETTRLTKVCTHILNWGSTPHCH